MRNLTATIIAAIALLGAAPPGQKAAVEAERLVLARVNGETITLADVRDSFAARHEGHGGLMVGEQIIRTVVQKAIEERLLVQEGRRMGIPDQPEFKHEMEVYRDSLLLEALEEKHVRRAARPTEQEIRTTYDLLPRRLRVFVVETRDRATAGEARLRLVMGEEIDKVARRMSVHQSKTRGGDLGWISWGVLDEATEKTALSTPVGTLSEPFAAGDGFRIVKVTEETVGEPPPYEQVAERIGAVIAARRQKTVEDDLIASIRKAHPPKEDRAMIARLLAAPPAEEGKPAEPPDASLLATTAGGLAVTAGHVRHRASRGGLSIDAALRSAIHDALLIDEARRRLGDDAAIERRVAVRADQKIREEVEGTAVLKGLKITDADARAYYERNAAALSGPESFRLRHIVLGTREEADRVRARVVAGGDFAALAKRHSIDKQTAESGGDLGWMDGPTDGSREGVLALKPGETSGVIETQLGWAIVQVIESRKPEVKSYEAVRHAAAERLMIQKQKDLRDAFLARLREVARISVSEPAIVSAVQLQDEQAGRALAPAASTGGHR